MPRLTSGPPSRSNRSAPAPKLCDCHGEPGSWIRDSRYSAGGYLRCLVKSRAYQRDRYDTDPVYRAKALARQRDRYDRDPIFRIEKRLSDDARRRAHNLKRRREALHGEISPEGRR